MSVFSFPKAPEGAVGEDPKSMLQALRRVAGVLNSALTGKLNALGEVTLVAGGATTTLTDARLTIGSFIKFDPMTANAATELAAGTLYVLEANRRNGSFVLTHANNAQTDRTFKYFVVG